MDKGERMHSDPFLIWAWKEFLFTLSDWPLGTILAILMGVVILLLAGILAFGLFVAVDSWGLPRKRGTGVVLGKSYTPTHTTTHLMPVGKAMVPMFTTHPASWAVEVEIDGDQGSISVTEELYNELSQGSSVHMEFVRGRFSRELYLKGLASDG